MVKTCTSCELEKPLTEFYWNKSKKDKRGGFHQSRCKACAKKATATVNRKRYQALSEAERQELNLRRHGITVAEFNRMLEEQDGRCPICTTELTAPRIDHDHRCCPGRQGCSRCVRGLLCATCNQGVGLLRDSADNLARAASYLRRQNVV